MSVLLFSDDAQLSALIETQLLASGMSVQSADNTTDITSALRSELPDAVVCDLGHRPREVVRLVEETARSYPAAQVPLIVLHRGRALSDRIPVTLQLNRQSLPSDLGRRLRTLVEVHQNPDIHGQAHPYALEVVAGVWRKALNGNIVIDGTAIALTLCDGGIVDPDELPLLEQALTQRGVRFVPDSCFGLGDWYTVGQLLYNAARTRTGERFLAQNRRRVLKPRPNSSRAEQLPLAEATLALLEDRRSAMVPLGRQLHNLGISPDHVEQDLEVLWLLGLYRFQAPPARPASARKALAGLPPPTSRRSRSPSPSPGPTSSNIRTVQSRLSPALKEKLERKRLHREVRSLAEADDWTVLSLQPTADRVAVEQASQRMQARYLSLARQASNTEVRSLAQQLITRIEEATAALQALLAIYDAYGPPDDPTSREEIAFREGFSALQRRDLPRAHRLFSAAYDAHMQSPRNLAYLAWTTHLTRGASHLDEVLEYLQLSDSLIPEVPQTQLFLATVEAEKGELERAEQRLARLIKSGQASQETHSLYRRVRQQKAQRR